MGGPVPASAGSLVRGVGRPVASRRERRAVAIAAAASRDPGGPDGTGDAIEGRDRGVVRGRVDDGLGALPQRALDRFDDRDRRRLPSHRTGSKIALHLQTLAVQQLPFVVRDLDRREQMVDGGQVDGRRIIERRLAVERRAAGQPGEPILDPLGLGADREMRGRSRQPAGHRGARAHDVGSMCPR